MARPVSSAKRIALEARGVPEFFKAMARDVIGYTGRKWTVCVHPDMEVTLHNLSGSGGGTWSDFWAVEMREGGRVEPAHRPEFLGPTWGRAPTVPIPEGVAIVERARFCGEDLGVLIHIRPDSAQGLLPAPVELTPEETTVLFTTGASQDSKRETYRRYRMTPEKVEQAKASLVSKGLLTRGGARTAAGKNATPSEW